MRVLIVEDEVFIAMEMAEALADAGCEVVGVAASVKKALALLSEQAFDAAVLDANLNGEPTDKVAEALREHRIPFLVVSGYACPTALGGTDFLPKPYSLSAFVTAVQKLAPSSPALHVA